MIWGWEAGDSISLVIYFFSLSQFLKNYYFKIKGEEKERRNSMPSWAVGGMSQEQEDNKYKARNSRALVGRGGVPRNQSRVCKSQGWLNDSGNFHCNIPNSSLNTSAFFCPLPLVTACRTFILSNRRQVHNSEGMRNYKSTPNFQKLYYERINLEKSLWNLGFGSGAWDSQ